ncbi:MAG: response regulator [Calditrichaeota bacterium]|nr:MAG: response regulator [Calditrichota bacterium]MBL1207723.1 response regulator [Calditrichota bacterium]NOG47557.1 response regulator [Calditrichota bacterium]
MKKILIVDDEPNIVISLEFLMAQNGYHVQKARSGEEALEIVDEYVPDLILLDVMLPFRSGFEVCQSIREKTKLAHVKIILLTAKGREADIERGLSAGADSYIVKPFSTQKLVDKVAEILKS